MNIKWNNVCAERRKDKEQFVTIRDEEQLIKIRDQKQLITIRDKEQFITIRDEEQLITIKNAEQLITIRHEERLMFFTIRDEEPIKYKYGLSMVFFARISWTVKLHLLLKKGLKRALKLTKSLRWCTHHI